MMQRISGRRWATTVTVSFFTSSPPTDDDINLVDEWMRSVMMLEGDRPVLDVVEVAWTDAQSHGEVTGR